MKVLAAEARMQTPILHLPFYAAPPPPQTRQNQVHNQCEQTKAKPGKSHSQGLGVQLAESQAWMSTSHPFLLINQEYDLNPMGNSHSAHEEMDNDCVTGS